MAQARADFHNDVCKGARLAVGARPQTRPWRSRQKPDLPRGCSEWLEGVEVTPKQGRQLIPVCRLERGNPPDFASRSLQLPRRTWDRSRPVLTDEAPVETAGMSAPCLGGFHPSGLPRAQKGEIPEADSSGSQTAHARWHIPRGVRLHRVCPKPRRRVRLNLPLQGRTSSCPCRPRKRTLETMRRRQSIGPAALRLQRVP